MDKTKKYFVVVSFASLVLVALFLSANYSRCFVNAGEKTKSIYQNSSVSDKPGSNSTFQNIHSVTEKK